jgi:hypothetical protein
MRVYQLLGSLDRADLDRLGAVVGVERKATRESMMQAVSERLCSQDGVEAVLQSLHAEHMDAFAQLVVFMRREVFSQSIPRSRLGELPVARDGGLQQLVSVCDHLAKVCLLHHGPSWMGGDGYELPDDIAGYVHQALAKKVSLLPTPAADVQIAYRAQGATFSMDIVRLLARLVTKPPAVSKSGVPYKRDIPKLLPLFQAQKPPAILAPSSWDGVPAHVWLAFRVLAAMGLCEVLPGTLRLHPDSVAHWLQADRDEWVTTVEELGGSLLAVANPAVEAIFKQLVGTSAQDQWLPLQSAFVRVFGTPERAVWWSSLCAMLDVTALCGRLDIGVSTEHELLVRVRSVSATDHPSALSVLQPNFELLVPESAPPIHHFIAGMLAKIKRADAMTVYDVDRESVLRLCDRGWDAEAISAALQRLTRAAVPASVKRSIADYAREYERSALWDGMTVVFASDELAASFVRRAQVVGLPHHRAGNLAVIVSRSEERTVRRLLEEIGAPAPEQMRSLGAVGGKRGRQQDRAWVKLLGPDALGLLQEPVGS